MPKPLTPNQRRIISHLAHRRLTLEQLAERLKLSQRDTTAALSEVVKSGRVTVHGDSFNMPITLGANRGKLYRVFVGTSAEGSANTPGLAGSLHQLGGGAESCAHWSQGRPLVPKVPAKPRRVTLIELRYSSASSSGSSSTGSVDHRAGCAPPRPEIDCAVAGAADAAPLCPNLRLKFAARKVKSVRSTF